jgi:hypothetical protein
MKKLALKPVEDGEGVTKVAEIRVEGARSIDAARKVAFSVANAQLVRTPFSGRSKFRPYYGGDWLREGAINSEGLDVLFNGITVAQAGLGIVSKKRQAARILRRRSFQVRIRLGQGSKRPQSGRRICLTNTSVLIQPIARDLANRQSLILNALLNLFRVVRVRHHRAKRLQCYFRLPI